MVAGTLPAQPPVPSRMGPHPSTPLLSTLSILVTQGKPLRNYASNEQCSAIGIQETLCLIPHDLNKVMSLLFPFPPFLLRPSSSEEESNICYCQTQSQPGNTSSHCRQARAASHAVAVCSPGYADGLARQGGGLQEHKICR